VGPTPAALTAPELRAACPSNQENIMERAQPSVQIDNENLRVTEWRFAPGAATGHHLHEYTYVVVPMTTGKLLLDEPEGQRYAQLTAGQSYTRPAVSSTMSSTRTTFPSCSSRSKSKPRLDDHEHAPVCGQSMVCRAGGPAFARQSCMNYLGW